MRLVRRQDILDYVTYQEQRALVRARILPIKDVRRIALGPSITVLFENWETFRYQVQEVIWAERIVKEADIQTEIDTYNALLAQPGELTAAVLIHPEPASQRQALLRRWKDLPQALYVRLGSGQKAYAQLQPEELSQECLSSVLFVRFSVQGQVPVALGTDFAELRAEVLLSAQQRQALGEDLGC